MKCERPLEAMQSERLSGEGVPLGKRRVMAIRGAYVLEHALRWGTFVNGGAFMRGENYGCERGRAFVPFVYLR